MSETTKEERDRYRHVTPEGGFAWRCLNDADRLAELEESLKQQRLLVEHCPYCGSDKIKTLEKQWYSRQCLNCKETFV